MHVTVHYFYLVLRAIRNEKNSSRYVWLARLIFTLHDPEMHMWCCTYCNNYLYQGCVLESVKKKFGTYYMVCGNRI